MFLLDWYCWQLGLTNFLDQEEKVTSCNKTICQSYHRSKGEKRDFAAIFQWHLKHQVNLLIVFVRLVLRKKVWQSYRVTTGNWIWFESNFKGFRVQIEILPTVFDWIFKQQLNLFFLLSDWYCRKFGLTNLPGHDGKVMSAKKMISMSQQRCEGLNRDYWINISVILKKKQVSF